MSEDERYVRERVPKIRIVKKGNQFYARGHNPPNYSFYDHGTTLVSLFERVAKRLKPEFTISNDKPRA